VYKKAKQLVAESENFELPFGGKLRMRSRLCFHGSGDPRRRPWKRTKQARQDKQAEDNRWVIMAKLIPWSEVVDFYRSAKFFQKTSRLLTPPKAELHSVASQTKILA
jgi:hypothetical protein